MDEKIYDFIDLFIYFLQRSYNFILLRTQTVMLTWIAFISYTLVQIEMHRNFRVKWPCHYLLAAGSIATVGVVVINASTWGLEVELAKYIPQYVLYFSVSWLRASEVILGGRVGCTEA